MTGVQTCALPISIVLLESMQDGILYSNILLKLYLKSLKNGGKLPLDENIPYTAQMISTITRQQVGTVERALQIFMKLGLVEPLPSGAPVSYTHLFPASWGYKVMADSTFQLENLLPLVVILILAICVCGILLRKVDK